MSSRAQRGACFQCLDFFSAIMHFFSRVAGCDAFRQGTASAVPQKMLFVQLPLARLSAEAFVSRTTKLLLVPSPEFTGACPGSSISKVEIALVNGSVARLMLLTARIFFGSS